MSRILIERETTIIYNEAEDHALLWSASPIFRRRMQKLGIEPYKTAQGADGTDTEGSAYFRVPKR
jgi:hypothetical protein